MSQHDLLTALPNSSWRVSDWFALSRFVLDGKLSTPSITSLLAKRQQILYRLSFFPWLCATLLWFSLILYAVTIDVKHIVNGPIANDAIEIDPHVVLGNHTTSKDSSTDTASLRTDELITEDLNISQRNASQHAAVRPNFGKTAFSRRPELSLVIVLILGGIGLVSTARGMKPYRGLPVIIYTFVASSILQTKIVAGLASTSSVYLFLCVRLIELYILFTMGYQLQTHFADLLVYMAPAACSVLTLMMALLYLAEPNTLKNICIYLFGPYSAIIGYKLITIWMTNNAEVKKKEKIRMLSLLLAPMFVSTFANWLFHWAFANALLVESTLDMHNVATIFNGGLILSLFLFGINVLTKVNHEAITNIPKLWKLAAFLLPITHIILLLSIFV